MHIEIISIGSELLNGNILNTNSTDIAQALFKVGFRVSRQVTIPDDPSIIQSELAISMKRSQIILTTGGLGSTCDDMTRKAAAELFDSDFLYDENLAEDLKQRYGENLPSLQDQATVLSKAILLKNRIGTAPGFILKSKTATVIFMPGIPGEMKAMLEEQVLPYLESQFPPPQRYYQRTLFFSGITEATVDLFLRKLIESHPTLEYGIYPGQGVLAVNLIVLAKNSEEASEKFYVPYQALLSQYAFHIFEAPHGKIEEAIQQLFIKRKWTLSLAESCTGGSLAARLTMLPGSSGYFFGSIVTYSNELKKNLLGVTEEALQLHGAVSKEVVQQMAEGLLKKTNSEFGIAVSGIAGPEGGSVEKPVGTVFGAISHQHFPTQIFAFHFHGNRQMIIEKSVNRLLCELLFYCPSLD